MSESPKNDKMGMDDFLFKYGEDKFQVLIDKAVLPHETSVERICQFIQTELSKGKELSDIFNRCIGSIATLSSIEYELNREKLADSFKINLSAMDKEKKKYLRSLPTKKSDRPCLRIDGDIEPSILFTKICKVINDSNQFFMYGSEILCISGSKRECITRSSLPGKLSDHISFYYPTNNGLKYSVLSDSLSKALVNSSAPKKTLKEIEIFSTMPILDSSYEMTQKGINEESKIYTLSDSVKLQHVDKNYIKSKKRFFDGTFPGNLLKGFCFKSAADYANYVAILLDRILVCHFRGHRPLVVFNGNQPQIGKTLLGQMVASIFEDDQISLVTFKKDEELEKNIIASCLRNNLVLIDNVKGKEIESPFLERTITSKFVTGRYLGLSKEVCLPNYFLFMMSMNDASLSRDLITRSIPINLHYEGDPNKRDFDSDDVTWEARFFREEIVGKLFTMVENWKKEGKPRWKGKFRFPQWASIIGGILEVNGFDDFLKNSNEFSYKHDSDFVQIQELFEGIEDKALPSAQLVKRAFTKGLFPDELKSNGRSNSTKLGKKLSRYENREFEGSDGLKYKIKISHCKINNQNLYTKALALNQQDLQDIGDIEPELSPHLQSQFFQGDDSVLRT